MMSAKRWASASGQRGSMRNRKRETWVILGSLTTVGFIIAIGIGEGALGLDLGWLVWPALSSFLVTVMFVIAED